MNRKSWYMLESSSVILTMVAIPFLYSDVIAQWFKEVPEYNPVGDFINRNLHYSYNIMFSMLSLYIFIQMVGCVFSPVKTEKFLSDTMFSLIPLSVVTFIFFYRYLTGHVWGTFFTSTALWIIAVTLFDVFIGLAIRAKIWEYINEAQQR